MTDRRIGSRDLIWTPQRTTLRWFCRVSVRLRLCFPWRIPRGVRDCLGGQVKVLNFQLDYPGPVEWGGSQPAVDLTRCTRCHEPWGFELVEGVEMWACGRCGYEAREKSDDYWRLLLAEQESLLT
jgi:hypothetical protein